MSKVVDYFMMPMSPWVYLGHDRFVELTARHGATVNLKPVDLGRVFPVSGGLPLKQRAPQRQEYRLVELDRWSKHLGLPLNVSPEVRRDVRGARVALPHRRAVAGRGGGAQARRRPGARLLGGGARHQRRGHRQGHRQGAGAAGGRPRRGGGHARDRGKFRRLHAGGDRPARVRRPVVRHRRRAVLGTGSARLPRPQTGKIACFSPDPARGEPGG